VPLPSQSPTTRDWAGSGKTGNGVVDPATAPWYLKNTPQAGAPDVPAFAYGAPGWMPLAGQWAPHLQTLKAVGGAQLPAANVPALTQSVAQTFLGSALARLRQDGVNATVLTKLAPVQVAVGNLGGGVIAQADPQKGTILLDASAAGQGWFVDPTPLQDEEFSGGQAVSGGAAAGRMDLLTAVLQEMAVTIGLQGDAFAAALAPGARSVSALDAAFAQAGA
jgi:hypothetical protein